MSVVIMPENLDILRKIINKLGIINIERYADLGCGLGTLTIRVANMIKPREVYGIDIDETSLKEASKLGIKTVKCDLNEDRIPLPDNFIDLVTMFETIEHLWNKDHALAEAYRILKPGGYLVLSTPNLCSWINRILVMLGYLPIQYDISLRYQLQWRPFQRVRMHYCHVMNLYNLPALSNHLRLMGFEVIFMKGMIAYYAYKNMVFKFVTKILAQIRPSLAPVLFAVARKPD